MEAQPEKTPTPIHWESRYSPTLEPDEQGRWARIALLVHQDASWGFVGNEVGILELAWVSRHVIGSRLRYVVRYGFPAKGEIHFETLEAAQAAVQERLDWFVICLNKAKPALMPTGQ